MSVLPHGNRLQLESRHSGKKGPGEAMFEFWVGAWDQREGGQEKLIMSISYVLNPEPSAEMNPSNPTGN